MTSTATPRNLPAYDGEGNASQPKPTGFVTLDVDSHYFELIGAHDGEINSVHIITDATIAGTFTIESTNMPAGTTADAATSYDETVGYWVKEDPTGAYVASTGAGWTWTLLTGVKTAAAGGAMIHIGNAGSKRLRLKAAITTGGTVRVICHGKD
jgi:hypothetical protein